MTISLTSRLCFRMRARTCAMSSPGSTTIACRLVSSPMIEQLHASGPTGRISWIISQAQNRAAGRNRSTGHQKKPRVWGQTNEPRLASMAKDGQAACGTSYFLAGAGFAGCVFAGCDLYFSSTEPGPLLRDAVTESVIEVIMKIIAHQVVALVNTVAAPRGPKAVWLPIPPK